MATATAAAHVSLQIATGLGGAAVLALGIVGKNSTQAVLGASMLMAALAGSHVGQFVQSKAGAIQADVSKAEQFLPILLPLLPPAVQAAVKTGDAALDSVLAAVVTAATQGQGAAAGQAAAKAPAAGGPSQA
jgi:hypothetical protein